LVGLLPADLPASVFIVLHIAAESPRLLADILNRTGELPCTYAKDEAVIEPGHVYLAPPDRHLLLERDRMILSRGPKENRHRPAIDTLFRSAAVAYGPRVAGVILTGNLTNGTAGLLAVKEAGGITIVQDPDDALYTGMPSNALKYVPVDYCLLLSEIPDKLVELARDPVPEEASEDPDKARIEQAIIQDPIRRKEDLAKIGRLSSFSCPECGGTLFEIDGKSLLRYRCFVGHAYTAEVLKEALSDELERALWLALRTLENSIMLKQRMLQHAKEHQHAYTAEGVEEQVQEAREASEVIRQALLRARSDTVRG
jgi:two-component system chemotaxis response regulator CheB